MKMRFFIGVVQIIFRLPVRSVHRNRTQLSWYAREHLYLVLPRLCAMHDNAIVIDCFVLVVKEDLLDFIALIVS